MAHLTLAGLSDDGKRLLLVDDNGAEFTLDVDASLRATLRGEHARIGQLEIPMDSALRPRDIQTRIRGRRDARVGGPGGPDRHREGHGVRRLPCSPNAPHVAQRAQSLLPCVARPATTGARTLGGAVSRPPAQLQRGPRRGRVGRLAARGRPLDPHRARSAPRSARARPTFAYDTRGNFVTSEDEDARWLVGESVGRPAASAPVQASPRRAPAGSCAPAQRRTTPTSCRWARTPSSSSPTRRTTLAPPRPPSTSPRRASAPSSRSRPT